MLRGGLAIYPSRTDRIMTRPADYFRPRRFGPVFPDSPSFAPRVSEGQRASCPARLRAKGFTRPQPAAFHRAEVPGRENRRVHQHQTRTCSFSRPSSRPRSSPVSARRHERRPRPAGRPPGRARARPSSTRPPRPWVALQLRTRACLSEDAACNRIDAARLSAFSVTPRPPGVGELSLLSVQKLRPCLTPENHEAVLARPPVGAARNAVPIAELAPRRTCPLRPQASDAGANLR